MDSRFAQRVGAMIRTLLALLALLALPVPAQAQVQGQAQAQAQAQGQVQADRILSVGLMIDPAATLDAAAAARAEFRPVDRTLTLGYSRATYWLRLRILPAPDGGEVVLLVRPPLLDDVRFYAPVLIPPGEAGPQAGPAYALQPADWPSSLRGYRLSPPPGGADYLVRISSSGSIAASMTARTPAGAVRISLITDLVQIVYFAALLVLLIWALRMLATTRESLFGWFSAMQAVWLFHNFLAFGYGTTLMPGIDRETVTVMFRTAVFVAAILSVAFHRALLGRFRPAPLALRVFDLQLAIMLVALAIFWLLDHRLGLQINAYCIVATPFVFLACILTARHEASPGLRTMRVIYLVLSGSLLVWVFSLLGLGSIAVSALYGFMIHGIATGVLMFAILHLHGQHLAAAARAAQGRIAAMEHQRNIQQEKTRTLAQFIDMLTHEARNALAVINMSIPDQALGARQRQRVAGAIAGLTGVIDRCNQTVHLDGDELVITREDCDLAAILHRLCADPVDGPRITLRADGPAVIPGDPVLLGVIFSNLIDNALKYSPPDSGVGVTLAPGGDGVAALFENVEGQAGRPDPGHVFQTYYRSDRAKAQIGSGLGLYIVRGLVERLGGQISYVPTDSHVRFRVWFPC